LTTTTFITSQTHRIGRVLTLVLGYPPKRCMARLMVHLTCLVTLIVNQRQVYLIGEITTEVWTDVGNVIAGITSFPFQRVPGTSSQSGIVAKYSLARLGETFACVAKDNRGAATIEKMEGYTWVRISTHAVEQSLLNEVVSDAIAYTYQIEGHEMYVVTFPSVGEYGLTWVYDLTTKSWHKWLSWDSDLAVYKRHRSNCAAFFANKNLVGDYENGKIYSLDNAVYTDDGATIRRLRRAIHLTQDLQSQYFDSFQIQFQPGVGLNTGQGDNPQAMLRWSNDGGSTWSNEHWVSIGKIGNYVNRALWRRLGWSRDRIFEVVVSDPIKTVIVSAELKMSQGITDGNRSTKCNINIPYSAFLDETTGRPSVPWLQWLMNPNIITLNVANTVITGGSINNVVTDTAINNSTIGLTTPAAGKFTDFTALNGVQGGTF
jgi:hypothetical protein